MVQHVAETTMLETRQHDFCKMSANYLEASQITQRLLRHLTKSKPHKAQKGRAEKLIQPEPRQGVISPVTTKHTLNELLKLV